MNNVFYVYLHRRATDGKVFYVGKGKQKRAFSPHGRNERWKRTYKKHGFIAEIVYENLTEDEAFKLEIDAILEMRYHFEDTLCNVTLGGGGTSGHKQSAETIRKRVEKNTGKKRTKESREKISKALTGKKVSEEARLKMSRDRRGKPRSIEAVLKAAESNRGKKRTEETKAKMSRLSKERSIALGLSEKMSGINNPAADKNVYTFVNIHTGEILIGTRFDLNEHTGVPLQRIRLLFSKVETIVKKHVSGWTLLKDGNEQQR